MMQLQYMHCLLLKQLDEQDMEPLSSLTFLLIVTSLSENVLSISKVLTKVYDTPNMRA